VVRNSVAFVSPSTVSRQTDLDHARRREPVETVQTRRRPLRRHNVVTKQGCRLEALPPRAGRASNSVDVRIRLVEPAFVGGLVELALADLQSGGLALGERTVLRGRKLNDGAHGVVQHPSHSTDGVSSRPAPDEV